MAQTITGLTISDGSNPILENAIRTLAGNIADAMAMARKITTPATTVDIERAIRTMQVIKGKTYSKALEKENGRAPGTLTDLGITDMLHRMRITEAELDAWYRMAEETKFQHTLFSPTAQCQLSSFFLPSALSTHHSALSFPCVFITLRSSSLVAKISLNASCASSAMPYAVQTVCSL